MTTKADADNLLVRIKLEALVSEREGMFALNQFRVGLGQGIAYGEVPFFQNADEIRKLLADVKVEP